MAKVDVVVNFSGAICATLDVPDDEDEGAIETAKVYLYHALECSVDEGRLSFDGGITLDSVRTTDRLDY